MGNGDSVLSDIHPQPPLALQMMQLLSGFEISQALYTVAKLGIADSLADGPRTIASLAESCAADPDSVRRIIRFLGTLGMFRTNGEEVEITELGATLGRKSADSAHDLAIFLMETQYAPFGSLLHTARTGETAATRHFGKPFFEWITQYPEMVAIQNGAMADAVNGFRAGMLDGYRLPPGTTVADLGAAGGTVLAQLLAADPDRQGIAFDLPGVALSARETLTAAGLSDRVRIVAGDFFKSVPAADVYLLSHVIHDWDDPSSQRILRRIAAAATPGARLVLIEMVVPEDDSPHLSKMTDLVMLAMVGGRERTAAEFAGLLDSGGFTLDRIVSSKTPYSIIEATLR